MLLVRNKFVNIKNFVSHFNQKLRQKHTEFVPLFENARKFPNKIAIEDIAGSHTYGGIFLSAKKLSRQISKELNGKINERVLFLCSNDVKYVITLWAIWMSGQIAVPLSPLHPEHTLTYYTKDTNSKLLVITSKYTDLMTKLAKSTNTNLYVIDEDLQGASTSAFELKPDDLDASLPYEIYEYSNAFILYTSGTTGNPKGVVLSHKNLQVQTQSLLNALRWSSDDVILHTLPLNHVHGTIHALFCPLYIGATAVMLPKFSAETVWSHLLGAHKNNITVFMGVPTIYAKLMEEYEMNLQNKKDQIVNNLKKNVRLMASGSAPLPIPHYEKWYEISGHRLLERYGMTEIGVCFLNGYESNREPGFVGVPLPGVSIRLADKNDDYYETMLECTNQEGLLTFNKTCNDNVSGELLVKGEGIFKEYFNKPELTKKEFTQDGWFKTGDMCEYFVEKEKFRMLGRTSVDIIKSGGYKISALSIETKLLEHPAIKECAVLGVSDDVWGEKVAAVVVLGNDGGVTLNDLQEWAANKMPKYCLPRVLKVVNQIPKNVMGKINKNELVLSMFGRK